MLGKSYHLTIGVVSFFLGKVPRNPAIGVIGAGAFLRLDARVLGSRSHAASTPSLQDHGAEAREKKHGDFTVRIAWFMMVKLIIFRKTHAKHCGGSPIFLDIEYRSYRRVFH